MIYASNVFQNCRCRLPLVALTFVVFLADPSRTAVAHDLFNAYIQHGVRLSASAQQIDLTLDLTFFEEWSAKERLAMDTDDNGRISRSEKDAYVKRLASRLARQVELHVAGRHVAIAPLYDPEVDLLGNDQVGPAHHRLRLFFFVVTPVDLRAGDEVVVENSLWPKAKALRTLQIENGERSIFEVKAAAESAETASQSDETRRLIFRCVKAPATSTNAKLTDR